MKYYFVIDTDTYAGNFERQTCAYITGQVGDCGVGEDIAEKAEPNIPQKILDIFNENIIQEPDEYGSHRPCKIYTTPGFYNNGMGFVFVDGEEDKAIEAYRDSCIEYSKKNVHPDDKENHRKKWEDKAALAADEYVRNPCFQSIAIGFYKAPDNDVVLLMKQRAEEYAKACREGRAEDVGAMKQDGNYNIIGYRLVIQQTITKEIVL